jgi:nucleotide-binding universal stress UspA family protein
MKKLLIPTDFSNNAGKAMRFAIHLAQNHKGIKLLFFHATETEISRRTPSRMYGELVEQDIEEGKEKLKKEVHKQFKELGIDEQEIHNELVVIYGSFKDNIKSEVNRLGVELIIMGTCGASGFQKIFFGSNTVSVMEKVACPVLAIPDNYKYHSVKQIAYAADFLAIEEGFDKVVNLAKLFNAPLEIFHVDSVLPHRIDHHNFDKTGFLDHLKKKFHYEAISIDLLKLEDEDSDDALDGIQAYVTKKHPSILAMATYDRIWIEKLINPSLTKEMMFQTQVPMFAFKKIGEIE